MTAANEIHQQRLQRARTISASGGLFSAISDGSLPTHIDVTVSEALLLGLLMQDVKVFFTVFGHGSTEIGEVLRVYQEAGLIKVLGVHNEIEASHAATALRWVTGEKAAVVTSIGPGALQALAASIVPASDGIGTWYLFGDETTEDEGFNMQQIPKHDQSLFLQLCSIMGRAYTLHTPKALTTALERGLVTTGHSYRPGPFFLLLPMNIQPVLIPDFNLAEIPSGEVPTLGAASADYEKALDWILSAKRVLVKIGGGARKAAAEIADCLQLTDGVAVWTPMASGVLPYNNPRNMSVGGSKGSLCGNYAMENADLLIIVGSRAVCQSDSSRTGYPHVGHVININTDFDSALHYRKTLAMVGDAAATLATLNSNLQQRLKNNPRKPSSWLADCEIKRKEWEAFKQDRFKHPSLQDVFWGKSVLTQPAAIKAATDWSRCNGIVTYFDAGDVQANGFQIIEDQEPGLTFTETGASYMGFACSALLASAATTPFYSLAITGDGSFLMNPQILIDGAEYGVHGCILLLDNNRMGAISGLQQAQYGVEFATRHSKPIDYLKLASCIPGVMALECRPSMKSLQTALQKAHLHPGLSFIHVPVYYGSDPLGGMGVFGQWNVGIWSEETQVLRHQIGL
jgi:3D-(3,5/4)-trihydroxycyclohexane-1,2-dione acylhydrolase (decyclizing)